jgi:predicted dehydrogenase
MNKIMLGVVGLGAIGTRMMNEIVQLYNDQIEISAICDADPSLSERTAKEYSVKQYFTNHKALLSKAEVDIVYIAVPPKYHEQVAIDTIAAGKHILCEKPLANSLEEALTMVQAVENKDILHMMNFPLNYETAMHKMMSLVEEGYIGKIEKIDLILHFPEWPRAWQKNSWVGNREQGGYILEVGAHWIQFIQKNFGQIHYIKGEVSYPEDELACEKRVWAKMELDRGLDVHVDGQSQFDGKERVELLVSGTEGALLIENWGTLKGGKTGEILEEIPCNDTKVRTLFQNMVQAINGDKADLYDFTVGYNVQVVLEAFKDPNLVNGLQLTPKYK